MSRILILDNSTDLLEVLEYFLIKKKYVVKTLNKADQLYEQISLFDPDVLIISVMLSGADGREICNALRKNIQTKHLCILLFSASNELLINYKTVGADDYLEKPFDLDMLEKKIESLLAWGPIRKKAFQS